MQIIVDSGSLAIIRPLLVHNLVVGLHENDSAILCNTPSFTKGMTKPPLV